MNITDLIHAINNQAQTFHPIEWGAIIAGLLFVVLIARENIWGWVWGIISCSMWAYATFVFYDLYFDAFLQLFYVAMGFWGIYSWRFGKKGVQSLTIQKIRIRDHLGLIFVGIVIALLFGYFFDQYTAAAATYLDALTTVFAILATVMQTRKVLENWLYWLVIDSAYAYLYISRGALLFALLMAIYLVIATRAYFSWKKSLKLPK